MHTPVAQVSKSMHPAAKMCTPGAWYTLNFEHCSNNDRIIMCHEPNVCLCCKKLSISIKSFLLLSL